MSKKALVIIDIQNDITKHYKDIINNINAAISWADKNGLHVVYIKHNYLSENLHVFKAGTRGEQLVDDMNIVSNNIFLKTQANALSSKAFSSFISANGIDEFYIAGADAVGCVKSTVFNMAKNGYKVKVISDCITSYNLKKIDEMLEYYVKQGCEVIKLAEIIG